MRLQPHDSNPDPQAPPQPEEQLRLVEGLIDQVARLEALQGEMVQAEIDRLGELATLMRIADSLACRRSFDEVLADCLDEVTRIVGCDDVWVVEAHEDNAVRKAHRLERDRLAPTPLPRAVRLMCQRVFDQRPQQNLVISEPTHADAAGDYFAMPIFTAKHLVGTLVALDRGHRVATDENKVQLIQSILRQVGMAAENERLIQAMTQMIVEVVVSFAMAIESRDPYTGGHVHRVTAFAVLLAKRLGLSEREQSIIRLGGLLHDVGKVAIPDAVLNKAGKLTPEEFGVIKSHPIVGHQIIGFIPQLRSVHPIVRHHHERWDGKGYPDGLAREEIPLLARVLAVADTFDAMTTNRSYRSALSPTEAMQEILRCAGTQFDAQVAEIFAQFEPHELDAACEEMREWCRTASAGGADVMDLIDLGMAPMMRRAA